MDAVIYTKSVPEYETLSGILADGLPGVAVRQGMMDGHYHLEQGYDIVVIGVDGAQGMELYPVIIYSMHQYHIKATSFFHQSCIFKME